MRDVKVDIEARLNVSESVAKGCLGLVEVYINESGRGIVCDRREDGTVSLDFTGESDD